MSNATLNEYLDALLEDLDRTSDDYAAITEAIRAQSSLLVSEWSGIKRILQKDDEVQVSLGTKFVQAGRRVKGAVKIAYAEKFSADAEFITPDSQQGNLFKAKETTVSMKVGDGEFSNPIPLSQFEKLAKAGISARKTIAIDEGDPNGAKKAADAIIADAAKHFGHA